MEASEVLLIVYGPAIGYLLLNSVQQGKKISLIGAKMDSMGESLLDLKTRLDTFIRGELDMLKSLAEQAKK